MAKIPFGTRIRRIDDKLSKWVCRVLKACFQFATRRLTRTEQHGDFVIFEWFSLTSHLILLLFFAGGVSGDEKMTKWWTCARRGRHNIRRHINCVNIQYHFNRYMKLLWTGKTPVIFLSSVTKNFQMTHFFCFKVKQKTRTYASNKFGHFFCDFLTIETHSLRPPRQTKKRIVQFTIILNNLLI